MPENPPDALLFITPGCPHCPVVLQGLSELIKQATIGQLTIINVAAHPELAEQYGVRAAPWLRLGPFTLTGAHSQAELRQWVEWSSSENGIAHYIEHLLLAGQYKDAKNFIAENPQRLKSLLAIVASPEKQIEVRVGVDALLEAYRNATHGKMKAIFQKLDHNAIYLLIAGSYTPFSLVSLRGPWGWSLFGVVWGLALLGMVQETWLKARTRKVSLIIYVLMGWVAIIALIPLVKVLSWAGFAWVAAGGLTYTIGIVFYLNDEKFKHWHGIWHLFVLLGSTLHYCAIVLYVA